VIDWTISTLTATLVVTRRLTNQCRRWSMTSFRVTTLQTMWNSPTIPWHSPYGSWHSCPC